MRKMFIVSIFSISLFSCGDFFSAKKRTVLDPDKKYQITLSSGWKIMDKLHEDAEIQAGNELSDKFLLVFIEAKEDFADDINLKKYRNIIKKNMSGGIKNFSSEEKGEGSVNGFKSESYIYSGSVDEIKIKYYITYIETEKNYIQVLFWTLNSKFDGLFNEFDAIKNSFKYAESANSVAK